MKRNICIDSCIDDSVPMLVYVTLQRKNSYIIVHKCLECRCMSDTCNAAVVLNLAYLYLSDSDLNQ